MSQTVRWFSVLLLCACVVDLAIDTDPDRVEKAKTRAVEVAVEILEAENNAQGLGT